MARTKLKAAPPRSIFAGLPPISHNPRAMTDPDPDNLSFPADLDQARQDMASSLTQRNDTARRIDEIWFEVRASLNCL